MKGDIHLTPFKGRLVLQVEGTYGRKDKGRSVWVARIDGLDPKFGYARTFIGTKQDIDVDIGPESWRETHVLVEIDEICVGVPPFLLQISTGKWQRTYWWFNDVRYSAQCLTNGWGLGGPDPSVLEELTGDQFRQKLGVKVGRPEFRAAQAAKREPESSRKVRVRL